VRGIGPPRIGRLDKGRVEFDLVRKPVGGAWRAPRLRLVGVVAPPQKKLSPGNTIRGVGGVPGSCPCSWLTPPNACLFLHGE
jgi:hypothetical protein